MSFDKLFGKAFRGRETCLQVNNRLCGKLFLQDISHLMIIVELPESHVLLQTLVHLARNLITSVLHCDTQSFYINTKRNL